MKSVFARRSTQHRTLAHKHRKSEPFRPAISMLNSYQPAGRNLSSSRRAGLEAAKEELSARSQLRRGVLFS
ncbi:MAG: DUF3175 domain-containing protein [Acidobacteria bacterium]|nr:DUF3175 domain-containing protein [Acidobacteriota bacterium]MCI0628166.1 DUF3175 domain-containing protein [Acidobacteriota bacterium]MCI0718821.1 DUF3175 domain-containing protein [Acidobacteriota bacterium]